MMTTAGASNIGAAPIAKMFPNLLVLQSKIEQSCWL